MMHHYQEAYFELFHALGPWHVEKVRYDVVGTLDFKALRLRPLPHTPITQFPPLVNDEETDTIKGIWCSALRHTSARHLSLLPRMGGAGAREGRDPWTRGSATAYAVFFRLCNAHGRGRRTGYYEYPSVGCRSWPSTCPRRLLHCGASQWR
ncbi:hypothetical protein OG21DRAFT_1333922 [Imleria badia]|nr:hypothetical protein OG21DRAFT_1333922 [Imleria badia]